MDSVPRNVPTRRALPTCDAHHGQPAVVQLLVLGLPELVPDALLILARSWDCGDEQGSQPNSVLNERILMVGS